MYEVKKRFEISAAHKLDLDYDSKCTNFHGHNWIIDVYLQSETLDKNVKTDRQMFYGSNKK